MKNEIWTYLRNDKRLVSGWLQRIDAEIIGAVLSYQDENNISGGCVEIGVHQGKSFIPLCLSLKKHETALCIDLFENQEMNLDNSGKGDFNAFMENLNKFNVDLNSVRIFKGSSENVKADYVISQVGQVRFFSVDGGHWSLIVQNDLNLAEKVLIHGGVIALDDYCRADWPEVTLGYALWQNQTDSNIVPFANGTNKLYLCHRDYVNKYQQVIRTPFLSSFFAKSYQTSSLKIDSYRIEPFKQDEEKLSHIFSATLKIFRPTIFLFFRKVVNLLR